MHAMIYFPPLTKTLRPPAAAAAFRTHCGPPVQRLAHHWANLCQRRESWKWKRIYFIFSSFHLETSTCLTGDNNSELCPPLLASQREHFNSCVFHHTFHSAAELRDSTSLLTKFEDKFRIWSSHPSSALPRNTSEGRLAALMFGRLPTRKSHIFKFLSCFAR